MNGFTGKILRINLTNNKISVIPTQKYEKWGGGHGWGSAIFWDLVKDKKISGFDPENVVTIMTSPLTGTLTPAGASRTEVQGIGIQSYPVEWFTRSNLGGRFGPMLKFAGWDGIVIEGKAKVPVWVDIRDAGVTIKSAGDLWGKDTWETQEMIWQEVSPGNAYKDWNFPGERNGGRTTQRPAVLTIGLAGENRSRLGALIHDAGNAAGQGGFGGVWGAKHLKAISVIGTGDIEISDPEALMDAVLWSKKNFTFSLPNRENIFDKSRDTLGFGSRLPIVLWKRPEKNRPQACFGCHAGCRSRNSTGTGNESGCAETAFYSHFDKKRHAGLKLKVASSALKLFRKGHLSDLVYMLGDQTDAAYKATDLLQKYGINAFEMLAGLKYLMALSEKGVLGPGKDIHCPLDFDQLGEFEFIETLLRMVAEREGIGDDISEGFFRASKRWGRFDEDISTGLLDYPYWGMPNHYDPRAELEWGYGSILGDRDINEHGFNILFWMPSTAKWKKKKPSVSAEEIVTIFSEKLVPFEGDPRLLDFSTKNMYSEHIAKLVSWHRHYSRFFKQSLLYCDFRFPDFYNPNSPDKRGVSGIGEPLFYNAVTGGDLDFAGGMEIGKKIWHLDNAIWSLQGRHRDMVHFADYIYTVPDNGFKSFGVYMPGIENGKWEYIRVDGRHINRDKFEDWKTTYYKLEGWNPATGWPERKTLEEIDLAYVADALEGVS